MALSKVSSSRGKQGGGGRRNCGEETALEEIKEVVPDKVCVLCRRHTVNEIKYGPLYSRNGVTAHYFCILLCSNLPQNGEDGEGIMGFLTGDIEKEVRRVTSVRAFGKFYSCSYCGKPGATIGCCVKKCKVMFHFPCGLKNSANFQFSTFSSFCEVHTNLPMVQEVDPGAECQICSESLSDSSGEGRKALVFGTCGPNHVFHRKCTQKYALSAGVCFMCPVCQAEGFKEEAQLQGVFVPQREAEWETERHAYHELYQKHSTCDANPCLRPDGRRGKDRDKKSKWYLRRCHDCASAGIHLGCSPTPLNWYEKWVCSVCSEVEKSLAQKKSDSAPGPSSTSSKSSQKSKKKSRKNKKATPDSAASSRSFFTLPSIQPATPPPPQCPEPSAATPIPKACDASTQTDDGWRVNCVCGGPPKRKKHRRPRIEPQRDNDDDAHSTASSNDSFFEEIRVRVKKKTGEIVHRSDHSSTSTPTSRRRVLPTPSTSKASTSRESMSSRKRKH